MRGVRATYVTVVAGGNAKAVDMGELTRDAFLQKFDAQIVAAAGV